MLYKIDLNDSNCINVNGTNIFVIEKTETYAKVQEVLSIQRLMVNGN